jgi:hypothetical protein
MSFAMTTILQTFVTGFDISMGQQTSISKVKDIRTNSNSNETQALPAVKVKTQVT